MIVGYFRQLGVDDDEAVSPMAVLRAERCLRIESDEPGLQDARGQLIGSLCNGDILVSPSIPHVAGSIIEVLRVARTIHARGATLRLVSERIDTAIPAARNVLAVLAEYAQRTLAARRRTGVEDAERRGAMPGRPRKLGQGHVSLIRDQLVAGRTYASVARDLGVHPTTVIRLMQQADAPREG